MKAPPILPEHTDDVPPAAIKCVIIYEDFATGAQAKHFTEMLAEGIGSACACESLWRSELMEFPEIGDGVAHEAVASDFVILALRGDRDLSFGFKRWIESWLTPAAGGNFSLIALFDPNRSNASTASAARFYLREMSAAAGVAFFSHCRAPNNAPPVAALPDYPEVAGQAAPCRGSNRGRRSPVPVTA